MITAKESARASEKAWNQAQDDYEVRVEQEARDRSQWADKNIESYMDKVEAAMYKAITLGKKRIVLSWPDLDRDTGCLINIRLQKWLETLGYQVKLAYFRKSNSEYSYISIGWGK